MSHNHATLRKYVFSIDVQMILVPFFDIPNPNSAISEKPFLSIHFRPQPGIFGQFLPCCGLDLKYKIVFSKIADFGLEILKNCTNII